MGGGQGSGFGDWWIAKSVQLNWVMGVTGISEKIRIGYDPPSKYQPSTKEEVARSE